MLVVVAESKMKEKKPKEIRETEKLHVVLRVRLFYCCTLAVNLVCVVIFVESEKSAEVEEAPICSTPSFCALLGVRWRYAIEC
jgi:hypothetical protein